VEQRRTIADPQLAEQRTEKSIRIRLKRQRDEESIQPHPQVRFINSPPMIAPAWFRSLLEAFPTEPTVVLLDNFENLVDSETQTIKDSELDEALRTVLRTPQHGVKIIITTQVSLWQTR
jgi:hypothetical protein